MTSVCWARSRYTNSSKFSWIRSRCVVCEEIKLHITILWRTAYEKKNSESRFCKLFMSNLRRIWCGSFSWQHRSRGNHTIFLSNASAMRRARKRHHATRWNSYIFIVARSHQYDKRIHGEKKSMHCKMRRKKMPQQYRKPYQSVANKSHFIHLFHVVFGSVFFFSCVAVCCAAGSSAWCFLSHLPALSYYYSFFRTPSLLLLLWSLAVCVYAPHRLADHNHRLLMSWWCILDDYKAAIQLFLIYWIDRRNITAFARKKNSFVRLFVF